MGRLRRWHPPTFPEDLLQVELTDEAFQKALSEAKEDAGNRKTVEAVVRVFLRNVRKAARIAGGL